MASEVSSQVEGAAAGCSQSACGAVRFRGILDNIDMDPLTSLSQDQVGYTPESKRKKKEEKITMYVARSRSLAHSTTTLAPHHTTQTHRATLRCDHHLKKHPLDNLPCSSPILVEGID